MSSILPIESANGRITLAKLFAYLDGEAERRRVSELETGDWMRNPWRTPVIDGEVDAGDLRESDGARLPMRRVVGLGPVVAVAYVMKSQFVALNVGPRYLCYVGLPVAIIGRFKCEPPGEHAIAKSEENGSEFTH